MDHKLREMNMPRAELYASDAPAVRESTGGAFLGSVRPGALIVLALAALAIAGCKSRPEPPPPEPVETPAPVVTPEPPPPPPPPPRVDDEGNPLDASGTPLSRTFYFEFDQARLSEGDLRVLAMHANYLRDFRNRSVSIEGHCDERGSREYNLGLGERRAQAVERYLVSAGVRESQVETVSYGEERPADPGHDERAWSKNRRAVLVYR